MNRLIIKKQFLCLLILLTAVCMSGCVLKPADQLYALPRQSDAYYNLQSEIEKLVTGTVSYCAPTEGENRQPIQIQDPGRRRTTKRLCLPKILVKDR